MGSAMTLEQVRDRLRAGGTKLDGMLADTIDAHLADKAGARMGASNIDGDWTRRLAKQFCPITKRPFFMAIEHPDLGWVATYGGPFDSFTIPEPDEDGSFRSERFDHDAGDWVEGGNPEPYELLSELEFNELWDKACR